ncbi:MAG: hypothetical protein ABSC63_02825 [Candidatus Binataceae bacterium]|jgi:hypothetical protein
MTNSDAFFLGVYVLAPLILLVALRLMARYRVSMAVLFFFLGPFAGSWALAAVRELAKPRPAISRIPGTVLFLYLFFGLPMFGLWVATLGVIGWWWSQRVKLFKRISTPRRIIAGAGVGALIGPFLSLALCALFLQDPNFPTGDKVSEIIHDPISLFNFGSQGVLGGAVCGMIIAWYLRKEVGSRDRSALADA